MSDLRSAPPARGVLRAPVPDGHIEGRRVLPSAELSPFVHHFWSIRWALRTPYLAEALPHPAAQIVIERAAGTVAGVRSGRVARRLAGEGQTFGITFLPAMFQALLRASMATLTDRVVPVALVLGAGADAWARAIHAEPELDAKLAMATAFLRPLLTPPRPEATHARDLIGRMAVDPSLRRVQDAAAAVDLDVRALQRRFQKYVGVSPKWVIQRYRLLEAAEQLKGPRPPQPAELAAALGYADQAHFARDFKLVIGRTPRSFALDARSRLTR